LVDRVHRELSSADLESISGVYHSWRNADGDYEDKAGWWKSATLEEIKGHRYVLTPGRYVGAEELENDGIPFEEKMTELSANLYEQFDKSDKLEATIKKNLEALGYGD
ncbi:MAG: N-6 DNA methylase, partial [candidate division Zixibacteria bacterium]|nr:N-6 DNA methylase [candidate division Zixibacteria bacterium]